MTFARAAVTKSQIHGTLALLRYYRKFLNSDFEKCVNPEERYGNSMTKAEVAHRLPWLVNMAINRKAGIPDPVEDIELWRDCQLVQHLVHHNNPSGLQWRWTNMRSFRTHRMQKRYGYLLHGEEDDDGDRCGPTPAPALNRGFCTDPYCWCHRRGAGIN